MAGQDRKIRVTGEWRETIDAHRIVGVPIRLAKAERERAEGRVLEPEPSDPAIGSVTEIGSGDWSR
ncbi:hypothetical protein GCM10027447_34900 [Glycomyces halotolerans]